jgi:hypothetical protein
MPKKPTAPTPDPRPTITRREVEYHQSLARGKAAQEATARGFDRNTVLALNRGQPCQVNDHLTLKPLTLQVEICLTEYTALKAQVQGEDTTPQKRLLHYVAFFAHPADMYETLSDPTLTPTERWAEFDNAAFRLADHLENPDHLEAASNHILRELRLLDDHTTTPAPATAQKKTPTPTPTRRRRGRRAAPPPAG